MESLGKKAETGGEVKLVRKVRREKATVAGSEEAKRTAAAILEVMSGARGTKEVSEALGISTMRYYALEDRALEGLVHALEPRPRGRRKPTADDVLKGVQKERDQLKRELGRAQALVRLVRKSVRLSEPPQKSRGKGKRHFKAQARTPKLLARLREPAQAGMSAGA
jgi:hypothetical protein